MSEQQERPDKHTGWYTFARVFGAVVTHTLCPVTFVHPERAQIDAPFIAVSNHNSWFDPVAIGYLIKRYETIFLGKKELTANPIMRKIVKGLHMIVVDRHNSDIEAMRACLRALKLGCVLGIFPEGTRHHQGTMEEVESGAGLIALRSGVPVVPILIDGTIRPFHRVKLYVGEPIETADLRAEGVNNDTCTRLMARITEKYRQGPAGF